MTTLDHAMAYLELGLSIIPVGKDKKPLIEWKRFQKERADKETVDSWFKKWPEANVGIVTGKISNLAVIDIDEADKAMPVLNDLIPDTVLCPVVETPSGGTHWYFAYPEGLDMSNNARLVPGADLRAEGGYVVAPPSTNGRGEWSWATNASIKDIALEQLPVKYIDFVKNASPFNKNALSLYIGDDKTASSTFVMFQKGTRDEDLFNVANALLKGGMKIDRARQVLNILARSCTPPFSDRDLEAKLQSALNRDESRISNLSAEVRDYVESSFGVIKSSDIAHTLGLSSSVVKKNMSKVLSRLVEEGILERFGNRNGEFRKIEGGFAPVRSVSSTTGIPVNIKFPLDLHQYAKIFRHNIVVMGGEKSTGKTGFCLELAEMNKNSIKESGLSGLRYISSEFGIDELQERLGATGDIDINDWLKKVDFNIWRGQPEDAILPDGLNIIDYLEVKDGEFYKIGHQIDRIFDKLDKGVAFIALQMTPGQEYARGGAMTLDKSRLYFTLTRKRTDKGIKSYCTIKDVKNRQIKEINVNGWSCEYRLAAGHKFKRMDDWLPS